MVAITFYVLNVRHCKVARAVDDKVKVLLVLVTVLFQIPAKKVTGKGNLLNLFRKTYLFFTITLQPL